MICDHAVIYKVSRAPLPRTFFFHDAGRLSAGNKGCWWLRWPGGAFIPWHSCESAHVSVCCWLADPQSGPHSCSHSMPTSAISRQRTALSPLSVSSWILWPCGTPHFSYLPSSLPPPPFKSLHLFSFLSTVTRLIGFALHGNAGCRCFKIEKWCKSVFPFSTTRFQLCKSFSKARWCTTGGIQWCTLLKEDSSEALFEQSIGAQCKRSRAES